ncbi:hypothetical protein [Streptosporangium saharense]|uniref:Outer membrane biosynthesis protein TonB n=1 Tax=Streptosporangium saharense TaxID=1706840 RepID=A0A7W7VQ36_9ACTN|nr:hypothetical protein [Streptosporangium saharense]MBB4918597.1 outer membrane biosynthesis protein TonB [Streptosporangium saharense]
MGRHGGHGEDVSRNRGKREPESAPEPPQPSDPRDELIGRRLRPEESAITEPAKGFLGSGWSATSELSDPVWPGEERRPKRRVRMVLLTAVAVVAVLGGSAAAIQLTGGSADPTTACPPGGCAVAASQRPVPEDTLADPADPEDPVPTEGPTEEPTEEPAEPTGPATEKPEPRTPAPATTQHRPGRTSEARPSPTPKTDHTPRRTPQARPTEDPEPAPEPTGEALVPGDRTHGPSETPGVPEPTATPTPSTPVAPGVTVGFGLVKEKAQTYTAQLVIAADGKLDGLTLKMPVGGEITALSGAEWTQEGGVLVLDSAKDLDPGENLVVTFSAEGQSSTPKTCQSPQADCVVV